MKLKYPQKAQEACPYLTWGFNPSRADPEFLTLRAF